jgi:hypothetical protein
MNETDTANEASLTALQKLTHLWWRAEAALEKFQQSLKMSTPEPGTSIAREAPHTDNSVRGAERANVNVLTISDRSLSIVAIIFSTAAITALLMFIVMSARQESQTARVVDAKIEAGVAQAEATAREARTHARVALDKVEDFRTKLAAKGIDVPPLDGH